MRDVKKTPRTNKKSILFFVLAMGISSVMEMDFFPEKPSMGFALNVILLIIFFNFIRLSFSTAEKALVNRLNGKPLVFIGIIAMLIVVGVFLQTRLF